jgi:hypothetical protein
MIIRDRIRDLMTEAERADLENDIELRKQNTFLVAGMIYSLWHLLGEKAATALVTSTNRISAKEIQSLIRIAQAGPTPTNVAAS